MIQQKRALLEKEQYAIQIVPSHSEKQGFIAVHDKRFASNITGRLGCVQDCCIEVVKSNYSCIDMLDDDD